MTMRKKLLITIACLSCILCVMVTGTIAWLTDKTNSVTNTFTPSNITVELKETGVDTNNKQEFKMIPGKTYAKDPKVTVTNDIDCYVFVKVEKSANLDTFIAYTMSTGWNVLDAVKYPGVYYRELTANADKKEFSVLDGDVVTVKGEVTKAQMNALTEETYPTLSFTAYACQQVGFATPAAAWVEAEKAPVSSGN